jgi:hypothetical protein
MESFFCLSHFGELSYRDCLEMTRQERDWYLERLAKQFRREAREMKKHK